ncbi:MAG: YihY/virulence factor BrkB family protein [Streptosporangiales bacterium]|nr:YihY/virulence factor BrkB family protein [Streptosporangiales bacterium]
MATATGQRRGIRALVTRSLARLWGAPWFRPVRHAGLIVRRTVVALFRYRVTGLAAEAAFWALMSLPPLVLGLIGMLGHFRSWLGPDTLNAIREWILHGSAVVLTDRTVDVVVAPIVDDVFRGGSADIISIGFLISLWSGSRALNVYVDTITIAYGLAGHRGIVRTRALSFALYVVGLGIGLVVLPLLVAGPTLVEQAIPESARWVNIFYWPVVVLFSVAFLASLYSISVPVRTAWWRDLPGSVVAIVIWVTGSFFLREYLGASFSGSTIYGSLAAPVAVLAWLYLTALAILIGASLNAEIDREWPSPSTAQARGNGLPGRPGVNVDAKLL